MKKIVNLKAFFVMAVSQYKFSMYRSLLKLQVFLLSSVLICNMWNANRLCYVYVKCLNLF